MNDHEVQKSHFQGLKIINSLLVSLLIVKEYLKSWWCISGWEI